MPPIRQIVSHHDSRVFTLSEARDLFPLVQRITVTSHQTLDPVRRRLQQMLPTHPLQKGVEREYEGIVKIWISKMERLGLVVKGLWLVDFDTGDGYLCWKFPELKLGHYHSYDEGYAGRRALAGVIEELDPDWAV